MPCLQQLRRTARSNDEVRDFYEQHPYPPPLDDLHAYRRIWDDERRRAESHLFWPAEPYRDDRSILVAGCGTAQAAHYAIRWPRARVIGIDVSANSVEFTEELKQKYALENLEVRQLAVERAGELGQTFDYIVCTGVLHHLADPDAGLRALRDVLNPSGAMHIMVYAPYGRAGVYMLQDYCKRIGAGTTESEIRDLAATLKALPPDHPIVPLLQRSPDFATTAGLADALLHPRDRAYSVPQVMEFLERAECSFARWIRQAPYSPQCGAVVTTPHASKLAALTPSAQYSALELFRGTMVRHSFVAKRSDRETNAPIRFDGDAWLRYVPLRVPDTIAVRDRLPPGSTAVLINRNHTYTDLYLPIDARAEQLFSRIDGERTIAQIASDTDGPNFAREFFEQLFAWDQVVFDASRASSKARERP
jgi:SAM-dependent methyltransferase